MADAIRKRQGMIRKAWAIGGAALLLAGPSAIAKGDEIALKTSGVIQGVTLPDSPDPNYVLIQTARAKTPTKVRKTDIVSVKPKTDAISEYRPRRQAAAQDAESQFALGLWCEANQLPGPAEFHFERTIATDPDHAGGRDKLGHVARDGKWLTGDEAKEALGWIKVKGKWVTPEEKAKLDAGRKETAEQEAWLRRLRVFAQQWRANDPRKSLDAQEQILAVSDPLAVSPLLKLLSQESNANLRMVFTKGLTRIAGSDANSALIDRSLIETDVSVWQAAADSLRDRKAPETAQRLVRALGSKNGLIRGRAAKTLAAISERRAVPQLIDALVQVERRFVMQNEAVPGGGGGMPFNITAARPAGAGAGSNGPIPQITTGVGVDTVVAPGVAVQVPYPITLSNGISQSPQVAPTMRMAQQNINHPEVLAALEILTGQNFGYNVSAWKGWARKSFKSTPFLPSRYVPQP